MDNANFIQVIIRGAKASQISNDLQKRGVSKLIQGFAVTVVASILIACFSFAGLAALAGLLLYSVNKGYSTTKVEYRQNSAGLNDDEIIVEMR